MPHDKSTSPFSLNLSSKTDFVTLQYCRCFCVQKHQADGEFLFFYHHYILLIKWLFFLHVELCWTVASSICWSWATQYNKHLCASVRHERSLENHIFFSPWKMMPSWAPFLQNVLTLPPSRAGKHSLWLIIHRRCVYRRIPVFVRVFSCSSDCVHAHVDVAFNAAQYLWCSGRVMEDEANESWQLDWSCRMQQIHNVNITDGEKARVLVMQQRWILFLPHWTALKLRPQNLKKWLLSHCLWDFNFVRFCNRGLFTKAKKKNP